MSATIKKWQDACLDKSKNTRFFVEDGEFVFIAAGDTWEAQRDHACVPAQAKVAVGTNQRIFKWESYGDTWLGQNGILAGDISGYEHRISQVHMARLIQRSVEMNEVAMVEAGTGTGKSYAYLVIALAMNLKVIISAPTINLQIQLYTKDIPALMDKYYPDRTYGLMIGKSNYVCKHKTHPVVKTVFDDEEYGMTIDNQDFYTWESQTKTGRFQDYRQSITDADKEKVQIDDDCQGKTCKFHSKCFYFAERDRSQAADVIVTNHTLVALNTMYPFILPKHDLVVIDEAHQLVDTFRNNLGFEFGEESLQKIIRSSDKFLASDRKSSATKEGGDKPTGKKKEDKKSNDLSATAYFDQVREFIKNYIEQNKNLDEQNTLIGVEDDIEFDPELIATRLSDLGVEVGLFNAKRASLNANRDDNKLVVKLSLESGLSAKLGAVNRFSVISSPNDVRMIERAKSNIIVKPVDVSQQILSLTMPAKAVQIPVVFCSATLASPDMSMFKKLSGIEDGFEMIAKSPFDYKSRARLYVPPANAPCPSVDQGRDRNAMVERSNYVSQIMLNLVRIARGGTFLNFSSKRVLEEQYEALSENLKALGFLVLKQGEVENQGKLEKREMIEQFKANGNGVLFGLNAFREGVDIPGEALRLVVVDKLPFPVKTPLTNAIDKLFGSGSSAFMRRMVPEMIIPLKQAAGRLIRKSTDYGVVAILDPRIRTRSYGGIVINSLPFGEPLNTLNEVAEFYKRFMQPVTA